MPSRANFVFVPLEDSEDVAARLLAAGCVVRVFADGIRISVRDPEDDDLLLAALAGEPPYAGRRARHVRATVETTLRVRLSLDGAARVRIATGAGLYDHFLEQLAFHAGFDLVLEGTGDLETGEHHTAEDAAIALGEALDLALGDRRGIARYGDAVVVMDDARASAAVDLGGRRHTEIALEHDPGLARHQLTSFADNARLALHVESTGTDPHHVAEAAFKATGRALAYGAPQRERRAPVHEGRAVTTVAIARYGAGNVRSVELAVRRLGAEVTDDLEGADLAVLPGVGSARSAMDGLGPAADVLRERHAAGRAILGICLGLQLALDESEEDGGVAGLAIVPGRAVRLEAERVPRIGWATVEPGGDAYWFAHSYEAVSDATVATSEGHSAIVEHGSFVGVQFHPEKSGAAGARFLERCLSRV